MRDRLQEAFSGIPYVSSPWLQDIVDHAQGLQPRLIISYPDVWDGTEPSTYIQLKFRGAVPYLCKTDDYLFTAEGAWILAGTAKGRRLMLRTGIACLDELWYKCAGDTEAAYREAVRYLFGKVACVNAATTVEVMGIDDMESSEDM